MMVAKGGITHLIDFAQRFAPVEIVGAKGGIAPWHLKLALQQVAREGCRGCFTPVCCPPVIT